MKGKLQAVGSDPYVSLSDLRDLIDSWIKTYGKDAIFTTDAGYNNVDLMVDTRKAVIKKYKR